MTSPFDDGRRARDWTPRSSHTGALLRLRTIIEEESGSRFVVAVFGDGVYRDRLIEHVAALVSSSRVLDVGTMDDFDAVEDALAEACEAASVVHVTGARAWLADERRATDFLQGLNYRRERLAARCEVVVVLWLHEGAARRVAREAPDF